MKTYLIFLVFLSCIHTAYSQGVWTRRADFAGGGRSLAVGFSVNGKGYIATGYDPIEGVMENELWEYNPVTDTWTEKANFPGAGRRGAIAFSIGNKGYVGTGGKSGGLPNVFDDFWEYDPASDQWTPKATFPGSAREGAVGFSIGSKGYVYGGLSSSSEWHKDLWEYNPQSDQWTQKSSRPGSVRKSAVAFVLDGIAYVGNGDYTSVFADFWKYDVQTDIWSPAIAYGAGALTSAVGFTLNGKGYVGTGHINGSQKVDTFLMYDAVAATWTPQVSFGGGDRTFACGFSIGNKGYIGTGYIGANDWAIDFWEFDPNASASIDQNMLMSAIHVYPNPSVDRATVELGVLSGKKYTFVLHDTQGRIVYEMKIPGGDRFLVETESLVSGVYLFKLYEGQKMITGGKLIKK